MIAFAMIEMLVQCRSVKAAKGEFVGGKVAGHPVENHANSLLMEIIDEKTKIVRTAPSRARRIVTGDLITPRTQERMLHYGHEFDVGEAEIIDIVSEPWRQLAIGERTIGFFGNVT